MAGPESSLFKKFTAQPDFRNNLALEEIAGGFDFEAALPRGQFGNCRSCRMRRPRLNLPPCAEANGSVTFLFAVERPRLAIAIGLFGCRA